MYYIASPSTMRPWLLLPLLAFVAVASRSDNVTQLVVRLRKTISVVRVNQDNRRVTGSESILSGIDDVLPVNLAVHFRRNTFVYIEDWTKPKYDNVRMVTLSSQQQTTRDVPAEEYKTQKVRTVDTTVTSVAVDWITDKVYMSLEMESSARIDVCDMVEDALCSVLVYRGLDNLHSLVVDPIDGYMYWLNQIQHRIERAWMDGRHHETNPFREEVDENRLVTLTALAIDHANRRLYYVRSASRDDKSEIWRCDLHNRESCRHIVRDVNAFYLDVLGNVLFWAPANSRGIYTCNTNDDNCSGTTSLIAKSDGIEALRVFDAASQPSRLSPNPCAVDNGGCSHLCLLIAGEPWRSCACPTGVRLGEDGRTCAPNGVQNALFVAAASGLYYISLDTEDFTPVPVAYKGYNNNDAHKVIAVDYDPVDRFVYWVDGEQGKIRRSRINGSDLSDVITDEVSEKAEALVVDWLGRNLFWLDAVYCRIEVARLDGSARRTIISTDLSHPRGLAIDPFEGYLYFSDWYQENPRIERAHLDGSSRQVLIRFPKDSWPNGLAVDRNSQRLYYTEARTNAIGYANLFNGRDMTVFVDTVQHPYGLSVLGPWLYYSSWFVRVVGRMRLDQSSEARNESRLNVLADSVVAGQMGIKATNLFEPPPGTNQCASNNGGCSHICLHLPHMRRRCLCPVGYELKMDNATCILPEAFLMFTQNRVKDIWRISLHRQPTNLDRLNIQHVDAPPQVIDFDQQAQRVYWSSAKEIDGDGDCGHIRRAFINGSKVETLVDAVGLRFIEGLAIDWVAGNLYWSDWDYRRIEVSRLDGSSRRAVIWKNVRPRVIAVNPVDGYIYWANWDGDRATMDRAQLDGNDASRQTIFDNVGRINAIALDFDERRIFWSELDMPNGLQGARISVAGFNGGGRRVLVQENGVVPYAMAYFADMLLFANFPAKTIEVVNASTGVNRTVLHDYLPEISNLVVAHGQKQKGWNECHENNGRCKHLCFARPRIGQRKQAIECGCPDHFDGFPKQSPTDCTPPQSFILVATGGQFARWKVVGSDDALSWDADPVVILPLKDIGSAVSIQFDPVTRFIYWINKDADVIYRARDNGTTATALALHKKTVCAQPHSLAVDVYGRQLFVSCTEKDKKDAGAVHVWRLDVDVEDHKPRQYIGCVVDSADASVTGATPLPRSIAIYPEKNFLFYVDIKHTSTIVRCSLNGRDCKKVVTKNLQTPTELHIAGDRLFYTTTDGVWSSSIADVGPSSGQQDKDLSHDLISSPRDKPMIVVGNRLLAVFGDSPQTDSVVAFDLRRPVSGYAREGQPLHLPPKRQKVSGLLFVPPLDDNKRPPWNSPCRQSLCSHLCRVAPPERTDVYERPEYHCLCSLGYSPGTRSINTCYEHVSCSPWQFKCSDGQHCVHRMRVCDGHNDCEDGSDEANCKLGAQWFVCDDGKNIERGTVCDGFNDCSDNSDESHCRCAEPRTRFDCTGWSTTSDDKEECIPRSQRCDGVVDCRTGADEKNFQSCNERGTDAPKMADSANAVDHITPTFLIVGAVVVLLVFVVCCILCYCKWKPPPPSMNASTARVTVNPVDGRREGPVRIEVITYSGPHTRDWPGDALPPPNSEASELRYYARSRLTGKSSSSGVPTSDEFDRTGRFYAPPPSAASMSTYGVVKPAAVKVRADPRRRSRQKPKHHRRHGSGRDFEETELLRTPPPSYSEAQRVTPCSTVVDDGSYYRGNNRDVASASKQQYGRGPAPPPSPATVRSAARQQRDHRPRASGRAPVERPLRHHQPSTSTRSYATAVDDDDDDDSLAAAMNNRAVLRSSVSSGDSDQVIYENMRARDPPPSPVGGSSDS